MFEKASGPQGLIKTVIAVIKALFPFLLSFRFLTLLAELTLFGIWSSIKRCGLDSPPDVPANHLSKKETLYKHSKYLHTQTLAVQVLAPWVRPKLPESVKS